MDSSKFKRNVFRTVTLKVTQAGLRKVARSKNNAVLFEGIVGLNTEVGAMLREVQPFLLGFQLNNDVLQSAFTSLGGVSYYVIVLAKVLKAKIPGAGKKVHLHEMTKTEALLALNNIGGDLMYVAMASLRGENLDLEDVKAKVESFMQVMWPLTYDLLGVTPSEVFEDYANRLAAGSPEGLFSDDEEQAKAAIAAFRAQEKEQVAAINPPKEVVPETVQQ